MEKLLQNGMQASEFIRQLAREGGKEAVEQAWSRAEQTFKNCDDPNIRQRSEWIMQEANNFLLRENCPATTPEMRDKFAAKGLVALIDESCQNKRSKNA